MNHQQKMLELLNPELFRANLLLCSVFIAYFENTIDYLIDTPKNFFCTGFDENGDIISSDYKSKVLSLDKKPVNASLNWFKNLGAINDSDLKTFDLLRRYRNKLSHELMKILLEEGLQTELYTDNLGKLFDFRIKLEKWWIWNFELDLSDFENASDEITEKDIISGGEILFNLIQDLLSDDPEKANFYQEQLKKRMSK